MTGTIEASASPDPADPGVGVDAEAAAAHSRGSTTVLTAELRDHEATAAHDAPAKGPAPALGYQPALDGLRGLALIAIFVFHAGFDWAPGAFLSVSTFFTLSGFLITTLLLAEFARHDRIDRRAFWGRRFRRLLPASLVAIAGIVIASAFLGDAQQLSRLRGDVVAGLAYVANWRFIIAGDSYGAMFTSKSPMQHFWSLAIEEQFYLVYPLVVAAVLAAAKGSRRWLAGILAALIALSVGSGLVLLARGAPLDRLYFGSDVRAAELLIGGLLAVWWVRHRELSPQGRRVALILGALAFLAMLVLWHVAVRTDGIWYHGGLPLYALLTAAVIIAAVQPHGPVRAVLSWRGIVVIGLVSYGAYLIHWPVFVWLDERTGLAPWPLFALRVGVTFALATASYFLVEQPIRHRKLPEHWGLVLAPVAIVAIIGGAVVIESRAPTPATIDFEAARQELVNRTKAGQPTLTPEQLAGIEAMEKAKSTPTQPGETIDWESLKGFNDPPPGVSAPTAAVFGDSSALMTGLGLGDWSGQHPTLLAQAGGFAELGCGTLDVERRYQGAIVTYPDVCKDWPQKWSEFAAANHPAVSVVQIGPWETADTKLPGEEQYQSLGDPKLDDAVRAKLADGVDRLLAQGSKVVLLTSPDIDSGRVDGRSPPQPFAESDPARMTRWNQILHEVASTRPRVGIVDLAGFVASHQADDARLRPDGVHFTWATSDEVAAWLGPEVVRVSAGLPAP